MKRTTLIKLVGLMAGVAVWPQTTKGQIFQTTSKADVTVAFDISQEGQRYTPTWGLDQAWIDEGLLRRGINHMGKENIGIGRSAYRFTVPLINDSALASEITAKMEERSNILSIVDKALPIVFTADQEAGTCDYFVVNKSCDINHWAAMINSHVHWMQKNTQHPVVGVSPFNEPDYWTAEEGATAAKQVQVAKLLRENYPRMKDVNIVGGNTLNDDKALSWYTNGTKYYDWGNTHQLAGSFTNYAKFYQRLVQDGKVGYNDEMHNVGEAMVGLEYGMTVGIWWGFDSRARGEFCDISRHGERIGYGEHRDNWTAASVYRHDDGRVKAFIGSSERQAVTTSYQFVSIDRDVFFDGQGPMRQFCMEIPGGTGYQTGQTNAERVIDINYGDDVPSTAITSGTYKLMNKATGNAAAFSTSGMILAKSSSNTRQRWNISSVSPRIGGDYSFYEIISAHDSKSRPNVKNFSTEDGSDVIAYAANKTPDVNEQWYFQYAGNGYYYIRNRCTALCLAAVNSLKSDGVKIVQRTINVDETERDRLLWRLLPVDVAYETTPPAQPTGLEAVAQSASVFLTWQEGTENDLDGYMVLRAVDDSNEWNTIARHVAPPMEELHTAVYVDNTCVPGHTYRYKVKAVDLAQNQSEPSEAVSATIGTGNALTGHWTMNGTINDATENWRHAATALDPTFATGHTDDTKALALNGKQWVELPVNTVATDELTIAFWVKGTSSAAWQRLFDFGHDTDHYLFLTPTNGSNMRLAIKNGGSEEHLDAPALPTGKWKHVAVTMKQGESCIYVDGELQTSSAAITIRPADIKPVVSYLGRSMFPADPLFTGLMQDVRIYNYALSSNDIQHIFDGTAAIDAPEVEQAPGTVHSLDGKRLQQPRQGLNIIDGKVRIVR